MTDQLDELTRQQNLAKLGWEAVTGKGVEWRQAVLNEELTIKDAVTLAIGQLQAASHVLKMFLQHTQPRAIAVDIAQEVASAVRDDLFAVKGHNNEEQRNHADNPIQNS